jgi:hypothetical protein
MKHGESTVNALTVNIASRSPERFGTGVEPVKSLTGLAFGAAAGSHMRGTVTHYWPEV